MPPSGIDEDDQSRKYGIRRTFPNERRLGHFRYMHTMIRVIDLDKSIAFYTELLGMTLLRRDDYPGGKFTNAFVGYGPEDTEPSSS